jgi:hypothetical protein
MKRFFPIIAIAIVGLIGAAGAVGAAQDQITGSARAAASERSVSVTAHGTPLAARGHVRHQSPFGLITGDVDCLNVQGNRAAASGELDEPISAGPFLLTHFSLLIEDNGQPNDGPPDDEFSLFAGEAFEFAGDCGFYLFDFAAPRIVTQGNLVVKDG